MKVQRVFCSLLLLCALSTAWGQQRVAFVKDSKQWIASDIGLPARQVPGWGDARIAPRWSPDGSRVLFARSAENRGHLTTVEVVIAAPDASIFRTMSINYADQPGQRYAGARGIKQLGWLGSDQFYLIGDIGPRMDEARVFRLDDGSETVGFVGTGFAGCAGAGRLAYWQPAGPDVDVLLSDRHLATVPSEGPSGSLRFLVWGEGCSEVLGLRAADSFAELVAFRDGLARSLMRLPQAAYLRATVAGSTLTLEDAGGRLQYVDLSRPEAPMTAPTPGARIAMDQQRRARDAIGSDAFDFWPR